MKDNIFENAPTSIFRQALPLKPLKQKTYVFTDEKHMRNIFKYISEDPDCFIYMNNELLNNIDVIRHYVKSYEIKSNGVPMVLENGIRYVEEYIMDGYFYNNMVKKLAILELEEEINNIAPINNVSTKVVKF